jgi:hypothetical protein
VESCCAKRIVADFASFRAAFAVVFEPGLAFKVAAAF